ncbi:hypothetical protein [Salinicoccus sp. YB14-2]|uniref:hypothetical protein n=1 Tax=Salinicoccus sp. YB14-2 TaxID=1572701 RepID=UPI000A47F9D4|nr:hypothetical protein [Salinicoccus sp. YB14-2]
MLNNDIKSSNEIETKQAGKESGIKITEHEDLRLILFVGETIKSPVVAHGSSQ